MGASTVEPMGKVICETTAEQYMVEVAGPKIEKMEESLRKTQKDVNAALERPLELGKKRFLLSSHGLMRPSGRW